MKRALVILVLALAQTGCSIEGGDYEPVLLTDESRQRLDQHKREFLSIEDIKLGDGPLAAWGRKIRADIEVRYTDATVAYRGTILPILVFMGMFSFTPLPRKPARAPSAKPVSGWESMAWRLAASGALPFSPSSSVVDCWSTDPGARIMSVFVKES